MNGSEFREFFTDAIRFWEPRRIIYNLALAGVVVPTSSLDIQAQRAFFQSILLWGCSCWQSRRTFATAPRTSQMSLCRRLDFGKCCSECVGYCSSSAP